MKEVQQELFETCLKIKSQSDYDYVDYCFLEVLPPFIKEGMNKCLSRDIDVITVVPYFLYPGMKLKDAVTQTSRFTKNANAKIVITKPLSYQPIISEIVLARTRSLLSKTNVNGKENYALLLIGHGSSDRRAREAFLYTVNSLKNHFRYVNFCFLELEPPNIEEGIRNCLASNPSSIFVIPYFLHKGVHIQKDILIDIDKALEKYNFSNLYIAEHIGVDPLIIDLVISLARDAENKSGLFKEL